MNTQPKKLNLAVIYGGRSGEHEVSLASAASVIRALNPARYSVKPILVAKNGRWFFQPKYPNSTAGSQEVILPPVPGNKALLPVRSGQRLAPSGAVIDVVLPLIHGTYGEDGCLQGLLELADIPYCGCDVLGSAVGMDKAVQKRILRDAGIPVVPWVEFLADDWRHQKNDLEKMIARLDYPVFVKPANLGSSVGISKVSAAAKLGAAVNLALKYDLKVIVEQAVVDPREIEVSVLGPAGRPEATLPGEVVPSNEFYDYAAKYLDGKSSLMIPADLPREMTRRIRQAAAQAFIALGAAGFARIDFLVGRRTGKIYLNEINTLPGFTDVSMYPKMWAASGLSYGRLLDRIIRLALNRHRAKARLSRDFSSILKNIRKGGGRG